MRQVIALVAVAMLAGPSAAQDMITLSPEQVGQVFCIGIVGNDAAAFNGLLTDDLKAAIAEAESHNAAYERAHPGDKPPLGDGIPWQDAPDYAANCTVGDAVYMMDEATVKITHGFPDYPDADFTDTLWLKLVPDDGAGTARWRIDNVAYASDLDLRVALKSAFMN